MNRRQKNRRHARRVQHQQPQPAPAETPADIGFVYTNDLGVAFIEERPGKWQRLGRIKNFTLNRKTNS